MSPLCSQQSARLLAPVSFCWELTQPTESPARKSNRNRLRSDGNVQDTRRQKSWATGSG